MQKSWFTRLVEAIFFGNYFYGICAIGLSVEASMQQQYPLNRPLFYVLIFFATVLYYTLAYIGEGNTNIANKRSMWYAEHKQFVRYSQFVLTGAFIVSAFLFVLRHLGGLRAAPFLYYVMLAVFPVVAAMYYGSSGRYNLRKIGWLKPFVIGFTWAGLVTVYPIIISCIEYGLAYEVRLITVLLFVKNFMFISVLCILFDIKDYGTDYNHQLKTFVVEVGLRKTIFYIIIPLCILGLGTFLTYGFTHGFSSMKIALNTLPFLALLMVAYSLHRRRSILYYLIIIDGLMLVKAICGITAMSFF
ncbi:MAG: hypothetical protein EOP56_02950 [Sphingobacteriales bacterium]|nr:MAG: hypothetical protein EOP56_02950 [Sphingobacteriales bacterium]